MVIKKKIDTRTDHGDVVNNHESGVLPLSYPGSPVHISFALTTVIFGCGCFYLNSLRF